MLQGKIAFITGTNKGIGRVIVEEFAKEGISKIYAHARKKDLDFEKNLHHINEQYNVEIIPVYFDMRNSLEMKSEVLSILKDDKIDILVNNAGVAHRALFSMTRIQQIQDIFDVNLFSTMNLTQIILKKMVRNRNGCIVNMSSILGIEVMEGNSGYGVSKAAIKAWTETLSKEVAGYGVRVNAIAPGVVDTEMGHMADEKATNQLLEASGGQFAKPEDLVNIIVFLCSEKSVLINGQTIIANRGGRILNVR